MKLISDRIKTVWLPLSKRDRDIYETIPNDMVDPPKSWLRWGRIRITIEMLESIRLSVMKLTFNCSTVTRDSIYFTAAYQV